MALGGSAGDFDDSVSRDVGGGAPDNGNRDGGSKWTEITDEETNIPISFDYTPERTFKTNAPKRIAGTVLGVIGSVLGPIGTVLGSELGKEIAPSEITVGGYWSTSGIDFDPDRDTNRDDPDYDAFVIGDSFLDEGDSVSLSSVPPEGDNLGTAVALGMVGAVALAIVM